jgi:peroxiredoxin
MARLGAAFEFTLRLCYPFLMKLKQVLAFSLVAVLSTAFAAKYLLAIRRSVEAGRDASCAALQPEVVDFRAPDFELPDLEGAKQRLAAHRGKVVLLNFWATWCPPCVEELPSLVGLERSMKGDRFALLTVSVDESSRVVKEFLAKTKQEHTSLPILLDPEKKVSALYGTSKFPETYLIDGRGIARYKFIFKRDWSSPRAVACIESLM